ncbi:hypothetical protein HHI36_007034 [Cryptolaemus montrouzieri]|uniref:Protein kinase C n=1 Tax=Cryptolaemus montrouzieri TaxID=559131 RepID=A0ABD2MNC8_9CUCU
MPYYSELGLYSGPSTSSHIPLYLSGPYSNHSSILANNFSRAPPTYIKSPRGFRTYKPHLSTISERRTDSPLRRINTSSISYTPVTVPRPIKINTADIDVSINKYRKYDRARNKQEGVNENGQDTKPPSPSRTIESPRSSTELKEATPTTNIKRQRATVRLKTIHKDKVMNPQVNRKWRDNFDPEELYPEEAESPKIMKKSPGELLKEKFLIPSENENHSPEMQEKKIERRKSVKPKKGVVKTPSFHDICTAITSEVIDEELNPGQPIEVQRRQSRQFSTEDILKEFRRTSVELSDSEKNVIDAILTKVTMEKSKDKPDREYDSRGSVKKKKKYTKTHSSRLNLDSAEEESKQPNLCRRATLKKISRTKSSDLDLDGIHRRIDSSEKCNKNEDKETLKQDNQKTKNPVITATVNIEEKPVLKAVIDDIMIEESPSPKQKKGGRLKFDFTVEEIQENGVEVRKPPVKIDTKTKDIKQQEFKDDKLRNSKNLTKLIEKDASHDINNNEERKEILSKPKETKTIPEMKKTKKIGEIITNSNQNENGKNKDASVPATVKDEQKSPKEEKSIPIVIKEKKSTPATPTQKGELVKVEVPVRKKPLVSNIVKKKHTARIGLVLEEIKESEERTSSRENSSKKGSRCIETENKKKQEIEETKLPVINIQTKTVENKTSKSTPKLKNNITGLKKRTPETKVQEINNNTIQKSESSEDFWKIIGPRESVICKGVVVKNIVNIPEETKEIKESVEAKKNAKNEKAATELNNKKIVSKKTINTVTKSEAEIKIDVDEIGKKGSGGKMEKGSKIEVQQEKTKENVLLTIEPSKIEESGYRHEDSSAQQTQVILEVEKPMSEAEMKRMISKRSLIQKAKKEDPDLVVFEPPPEPEPELEKEEEEEKKSIFVPLQSNRLSQWMNPFKKPEQFDECPVEIYARPKTIRKRHFPRGRHGQWEHYKQESSSEEESDSSESDDDDSTDGEEHNTRRVGAHYGASTSSNDSGFDSGAAKNKDKDCDVNCHKKCEKLTANLCGVNQKLIVEAIESVKKGSTSDTRDSPSSNPATNPAFAIDLNEEECCQSSTYQGFQKSGRITPPATTIPRFRKYCVEDFHFLKVLGKGSFGKVLLAELKDTEYYYAIKCLKKDVVLEDDDVECTLIERKVLALGTKHPYLCHLLCTFQNESHLFFVMEYLNGGDLMFHIQQSGRFSEDRARFYGAEIVSGLKFLHNKGIVYRDLKLDNILLDFDGHVRIADFGMCKLQVFLDRMADTFCGTPDYMAPEIIKGQHYNQSVDWWSFGVLLYEMLLAQSPFSGCDEDALFWSICNEKPVLPRFLSSEATRILSMLLEKDASKRLGTRFSPCGDIKDQPFFKSIDWDQLEARLLEPPFKPKLSHPLDTKYFDKHFTVEQAKLTPIEHHILESMDQTQFQGFSYTNPNATDK